MLGSHKICPNLVACDVLTDSWTNKWVIPLQFIQQLPMISIKNPGSFAHQYTKHTPQHLISTKTRVLETREETFDPSLEMES